MSQKNNLGQAKADKIIILVCGSYLSNYDSNMPISGSSGDILCVIATETFEKIVGKTKDSF